MKEVALRSPSLLLGDIEQESFKVSRTVKHMDDPNNARLLHKNIKHKMFWKSRNRYAPHSTQTRRLEVAIRPAIGHLKKRQRCLSDGIIPLRSQRAVRRLLPIVQSLIDDRPCSFFTHFKRDSSRPCHIRLNTQTGPTIPIIFLQIVQKSSPEEEQPANAPPTHAAQWILNPKQELSAASLPASQPVVLYPGESGHAYIRWAFRIRPQPPALRHKL
jgi:hypothetical protein